MTLYRNQFRVETTRLKDWDYSSPGWYFVTICAAKRDEVFGRVDTSTQVNLTLLGECAESHLRALPSHYDNVVLDAFVVMPDHLHAILVIEGDHQFSPELSKGLRLPSKGFTSPHKGSLSVIVRSYKAGVSRWCTLNGLAFAWQARFYDHILRSNRAVNAAREYIASNPLRWLENHGVAGRAAQEGNVQVKFDP